MADSPAEGEAAQALFCAIADYVGKNNIKEIFDLKKYPTYKDFKKADAPKKISALTPHAKKNTLHEVVVKPAWDQTELPSMTLPKIDGYLIKHKGWYISSVVTAEKLINDINKYKGKFPKIQTGGWQHIMYVRGAKGSKSVMNNIEALFKIANTNNKQFGDVNKWSPADIYFASEIAETKIEKLLEKLNGKKSLEESFDFDSLNKIIDTLLKAGDLLPLSLKKVISGTASLHNYNFNRTKEEKELADIKYLKTEYAGKYTVASPKTRDLKLFWKDTKHKLKWRHDPSDKTMKANLSSFKVEIEVSGAGGRGGSAVGIRIISEIIRRLDPVLATDFANAFKKGSENFEKHLTGKSKSKTLSTVATTVQALFKKKGAKKLASSLNNKYGVKVGDKVETVWPNPKTNKKYIAYKDDRAHLSAIFICNPCFAIIDNWVKANKSVEDEAQRQGIQGPISKLMQYFIQYASSRSPMSGKFVIAKD